MAMVQHRAAWMQLGVLHAWHAWVQHRQAERAQLQRAVRKLAGVCQRNAFGAWRAEVAERRAAEQLLAVVQRRLAARAAGRSAAAAFRGWRAHTAMLAAARAAVDAKVAAEGAVVRRHTLAAWRGATLAQAERHDHLLRVCVERRAAGLQSKSLFAWQLFAQVGGWWRVEGHMGVGLGAVVYVFAAHCRSDQPYQSASPLLPAAPGAQP